MEIGKTLIVIGAVLIGAGLLWLSGSRLGLGHLPGDIVIERENFRLYLPLGTCLLISVVLFLACSGSSAAYSGNTADFLVLDPERQLAGPQGERLLAEQLPPPAPKRGDVRLVELRELLKVFRARQEPRARCSTPRRRP